MLRAQLAALHRDRSADEIEEAVQIACRRFVDRAEGISAPGQVYAWIRTTAHRELNREVAHKVHEIPVDPEGEAMRDLVTEQPGPEEEANRLRGLRFAGSLGHRLPLPAPSPRGPV